MALENHSSEIQQKRFEKGNLNLEIKILSTLPSIKIFPRKAPFGLIIRIIFIPNQQISSELHFDLYLEGKYPFQSPKLMCESVCSFPSVSDGRDLIEELLSTRWSPSITCADIVSMIPKFYLETIRKHESELFNKNFGKFHLGAPYLLDLWHDKSHMGSFYCTEHDLNSLKFIKERTIVVTHTMILIFELNTQIIDVGYLISWATLQSINTIKRTINEPESLTFEWKKIGESQAYAQYFKVPQASQLIELISGNMKRIMRLNQELADKFVFKEEEVTGKAIKNMKIGEILEEIGLIERHLDKNLTIKIVNHLMELYQHVIEYFTAFGDMQFQVYLKKMHELLSNDKVTAVLQGLEVKEDEKKSSEDMNKVTALDLEIIKKEDAVLESQDLSPETEQTSTASLQIEIEKIPTEKLAQPEELPIRQSDSIPIQQLIPAESENHEDSQSVPLNPSNLPNLPNPSSPSNLSNPSSPSNLSNPSIPPNFSNPSSPPNLPDLPDPSNPANPNLSDPSSPSNASGPPNPSSPSRLEDKFAIDDDI